MSRITSAIIDSMARTLYVSAYASAVEENEIEGTAAGPGEDWIDVAPSTPDYARDAALLLAGRIHQANGMSLLCLIYQAAKADGISTDGWSDTKYPNGEVERYWWEQRESRRCNYAEAFGHYLAMMCLGEGVSWFDDHEEFTLETPLIDGIYLEDSDLTMSYQEV